MLNGSIKKYEETRTPTYSYPNYYNGYDGMYGDYDTKHESLAEQYEKLQAYKNAAIAKGFNYGFRVTLINSGATGIIREFAKTLRDGVDVLGNYTVIGVQRDLDKSNTITFYAEEELELIK